MTLSLAETSVVKSLPSVLHKANFLWWVVGVLISMFVLPDKCCYRNIS